MLVPPDNFALVEKGIYRCSRITSINLQFLKTIKLKTILWIDEESLPRLISLFIEENYIRLIQLKNLDDEESGDEGKGTPKVQEEESWLLIKPKVMSKILEIILDYKNNGNIMIVDKSEFVIGMIRKLQRWSYSSILNEYRLFIGNKFNYFAEIYLEMIEIEFIEEKRLTKRELEVIENGNAADDDVEEEEEEEEEEEIVKDVETKLSEGIHSISIKNKPSSFNSNNKLESLHNSQNISLSLSSLSPQIPKNLLKLMEKRKKKINTSNEENTGNHVGASGGNGSSRRPEGDAKNLNTGGTGGDENDTGTQLGNSFVGNGKVTTTGTGGVRGGAGAGSGSGSGVKEIKPINNKIKVKLPDLESLPQWYIRLNEDYQNDLNNLNNY